MELSTQEQLTALYGLFPGKKFDRGRHFYEFFYRTHKTSEHFFKNVGFDCERMTVAQDIEEAHNNLVSVGYIVFFTNDPNSPIITPNCAEDYLKNLKGRLINGESAELERLAQNFGKVTNIRDIFE